MGTGEAKFRTVWLMCSDKQMSLFLLDLLSGLTLYEVSALEEPCLQTAVSVLTWLHKQVQVIVSSPHVGLKTQASGISLPSRTTKWIFHYYLALIMTFYINVKNYHLGMWKLNNNVCKEFSSIPDPQSTQ